MGKLQFPQSALTKVCLRAAGNSYVIFMIQWYYSKDGTQAGPVDSEELKALFVSGNLKPASTLVWNESMPEWVAATEVPGLLTSLPSDAALSQPFAYQTATGPMQEIPYGSEPLIPTACVKRAFDLTIKHIGPVLLVTIIYVAIILGVDYLLGLFDSAMGWAAGPSFSESNQGAGGTTAYSFAYNSELSIPSSILSAIVNVFLMLGATNFGLKLVSGKPISVGLLFSGTPWLLKGFFAYILYMLMIGIGFVLLIFPGVYLMLRFGMYQAAIIDKNMGIIEAFKYSAELTKGNLLNLFIIVLFSILIVIAGCIAVVVGLLFAYPMIFLLWLVAYRWLQYGGRAIMDDPATGIPLLASMKTEEATDQPTI